MTKFQGNVLITLVGLIVVWIGYQAEEYFSAKHQIAQIAQPDCMTHAPDRG
jgi:hypothetical protein